ncbi:hypothetical protein E2C01_088495 [Portunus trituberculatus]|uniref:Uncharacterized protein n=1 Tax=Portunus trituberculatus TaxID=210409 RepID=A0A5B7JJI8_PORTR|nr:hypothetical protein [Portunus trituberculatus]
MSRTRGWSCTSESRGKVTARGRQAAESSCGGRLKTGCPAPSRSRPGPHILLVSHIQATCPRRSYWGQHTSPGGLHIPHLHPSTIPKDDAIHDISEGFSDDVQPLPRTLQFWRQPPISAGVCAATPTHQGCW